MDLADGKINLKPFLPSGNHSYFSKSCPISQHKGQEQTGVVFQSLVKKPLKKMGAVEIMER